ncbi:MAG: dihydrofolate reductase family protein [Chloroflexota bacterium]|nr:dihydrofolate reductase family protein [Chloroflexota bacterium]
MRKVISFLHVSLDGFTTGPNGELEWAIVDEELNPYVDALFRNVDTALYGRVTYLVMQSYWPTVYGGPLFQDIKEWMKLKLLEAKTFQAGVVGLHYQTVRQ